MSALQHSPAPKDERANPLISIPVPLADGRIGNIRLPMSLDRSDAERVKNMVDALTRLLSAD